MENINTKNLSPLCNFTVKGWKSFFLQQNQDWNTESGFYCEVMESACSESSLHANGPSLSWGRNSALVWTHLDVIKCDGYSHIFLIYLYQLYMLVPRKTQTMGKKTLIQTQKFNRTNEEFKTVSRIIKLFHKLRSNQVGKKQAASIFQTEIKLKPFTKKTVNWTAAALFYWYMNIVRKAGYGTKQNC